MRRAAVTGSLVVLLAAALTLGAPHAGHAMPRAVGASGVAAVDAPADTTVDQPSTTGAGDDAGIGGLEPASDTPSPRGEPAPPRTQRIADTLIFVGLLVVFVGGVAVALWTANRSRTRDPS